MSARTVLDLYRHETEVSRDEHYFHYTLDGHTTLSTSEFLEHEVLACRTW